MTRAPPLHPPPEPCSIGTPADSQQGRASQSERSPVGHVPSEAEERNPPKTDRDHERGGLGGYISVGYSTATENSS